MAHSNMIKVAEDLIENVSTVMDSAGMDKLVLEINILEAAVKFAKKKASGMQRAVAEKEAKISKAVNLPK